MNFLGLMNKTFNFKLSIVLMNEIYYLVNISFNVSFDTYTQNNFFE